MRRLVLRAGFVLILFVSGAVGCGQSARIEAPTPPPPWTDDLQTVADGNNRFALDLYAKLRETPGNLFFSPYSVHAALAMTATGAKGTTRDEMVKVLHLPADEGRMLAAGDLGRFYDHPRTDYEFSVTNALWGQTGFSWRPEFLDVQKTRFGAGFNEADFAANPDAERVRINRWVGEKTRERIPELLKAGIITPHTKLVLTNAIFFKGAWKTRFDPKRTRCAPFHLADDGTATVPLMYADVDARHVERADGTRVLELPYAGDELSMVVILPKLPGGLPAVERQLTGDTLADWLGELQPATLGVSFPRFKCEQEFNLPKPLQALGMVEPFTPGADFSGMLPGGGLWIGSVVHKAFVEVNEEGTVAAAATAVTGVTSPDPPPFVTDHPFLFLIRDTRHGTILFLGRVERP